jgi:peroxiredoxin
MLADGGGEFTTQAGLQLDASGYGMGMRTQRYAAILQDGVVQEIFIEPDTGVNVSSADAVLKAL